MMNVTLVWVPKPPAFNESLVSAYSTPEQFVGALSPPCSAVDPQGLSLTYAISFTSFPGAFTISPTNGTIYQNPGVSYVAVLVRCLLSVALCRTVNALTPPFLPAAALASSPAGCERRPCHGLPARNGDGNQRHRPLEHDTRVRRHHARAYAALHIPGTGPFHR
jgi:hypothetical protein